jgi:hypothetical protein
MEREIAARACQLWKEAGQPKGRDEDFWHAAEQELRTSPHLCGEPILCNGQELPVGIGWVCENYLTARGGCGAGMPCKCNEVEQPEISQIIESEQTSFNT